MKKIVLGLLAVTLFLLYGIRSDQETIIVYSCLEQFRGEELQKQLNEKFPQYHIMVMYVPTAKAAAKIHVEKEQSDADIIVALESSYMEKIKDQLADISGKSRLKYLPGLTPADHDNRYVTWERQAGAFVINKDVLKKHNLPIPSSYQELLDEKYYNLIAMPDPKSSGTGYFFYKNLVNTMGQDAALQYIDKLEYNIKQFTESGSGPIKLLIQGEVGIGLALTFQAVNQINANSPFEIVYPAEGSPYSLTGAAMMKQSADEKEVNEVFDFIINNFLLYDKEHFSPELILEDQSISIPQYPQNITYADMRGIEEIKEKERLLSLWKY